MGMLPPKSKLIYVTLIGNSDHRPSDFGIHRDTVTQEKLAMIKNYHYNVPVSLLFRNYFLSFWGLLLHAVGIYFHKVVPPR